MQLYCESLTTYKRLNTLEIKIGDLLLGNHHPIRVQTMTTTDTMDTQATVAQTIRCIEAGAELVERGHVRHPGRQTSTGRVRQAHSFEGVTTL